MQDRRGFMWFGTSNGLDKFDGYTCTHYKYDPEDSNSLSDNDIYALYEDRRGALWIGTVLGLNRFVQATRSFMRFRHDRNDPNTLSHDCVGVLYRDSRGVLWIGTGDYYRGGGGLNRLRSDGRTFVQYRHDPNDARSLNDDWVTAVSEDESGVLWVGTNTGLEEFDKESRTFTHHRLEPRVAARNKLFVKSVCEDASGVMWIGTWESGLYRCVKSSGEYKALAQDLETRGKFKLAECFIDATLVVAKRGAPA